MSRQRLRMDLWLSWQHHRIVQSTISGIDRGESALCRPPGGLQQLSEVSMPMTVLRLVFCLPRWPFISAFLSLANSSGCIGVLAIASVESPFDRYRYVGKLTDELLNFRVTRILSRTCGGRSEMAFVVDMKKKSGATAAAVQANGRRPRLQRHFTAS